MDHVVFDGLQNLKLEGGYAAERGDTNEAGCSFQFRQILIRIACWWNAFRNGPPAATTPRQPEAPQPRPRLRPLAPIFYHRPPISPRQRYRQTHDGRALTHGSRCGARPTLPAHQWTLGTDIQHHETPVSLRCILMQEHAHASNRREMRLPPPPIQESYCIVCMETYPVKRFPSRKITASCNHAKDICRLCLSASIASELDSKKWNDLTCPIDTCRAPLESAHVERYASKKTLDKYHRFMINDALKDEPNFRRCLGPNCNSGQIHELGAEVPQVECFSCGFQTCFNHKAPWHRGISCAEYDRRALRGDEAATADEIRRTSKPCPNCNTRIQHRSGCLHMTCANCRCEFCYACLVKWKKHERRGDWCRDPHFMPGAQVWL